MEFNFWLKVLWTTLFLLLFAAKIQKRLYIVEEEDKASEMRAMKKMQMQSYLWNIAKGTNIWIKVHVDKVVYCQTAEISLNDELKDFVSKLVSYLAGW